MLNAKSNNAPSGFNIKFFGFLIAIMLALILVLAIKDNNEQSNQCQSTCKAKGFVDSRLVASSRRYYTHLYSCTCLSKDEANMKNSTP